MASKVTFDGLTKIITILSGVTEIDVQLDLYSDWKEWVMMADNAKWVAAFRTFGGDQTSESQFAPRYFFLINGWKIEATNVAVVVQTNLYSDDGLSPFIIVNSAVTNRTSDVPVVKSVIEQRLDYGDRVYYDENSIYTGTLYPNGTIAQPVNNRVSAIAIANQYNIKLIYCLSDLTMSDVSGQTFSDWEFHGVTQDVTFVAYNNTFNSITLTDINVDADLNNGSARLSNCVVTNILNFSGEMKNSQIIDTIRVSDDVVISHCYSGIAGTNTPTFDMTSGKTTSMSVRAYSGGIKVMNCDTVDSKATIELVAGHVILDETCTAGTIDVRGVGYITDNSNGANIIKVGFVDSLSDYLTEAEEINQRLDYGDRIYYDENSTFSGTTYPNGTIVQPVNNRNSAIVIADKYNIKRVFCLSDITTLDVSGITFEGWEFFGLVQDVTFNTIGNTFDKITLNNINIDADINNGTCRVYDCVIDDLLNFSGEVNSSQITGTVKVSDDVVFAHCYSGIAGTNRPVFDMTAGKVTSLSVRAYSGGIELRNCDTIDSKVTIELIAGHVFLDSTCTAGIIDIRGVGYITDNSNGATIITSGFITKQALDLTELSEDVKRILGLTQENFRINNHVYDSDDKLESATVKTYSSSTDTDNDINPLATYGMSAIYDVSGRLIDYKMTKN